MRSVPLSLSLCLCVQQAEVEQERFTFYLEKKNCYQCCCNEALEPFQIFGIDIKILNIDAFDKPTMQSFPDGGTGFYEAQPCASQCALLAPVKTEAEKKPPRCLANLRKYNHSLLLQLPAELQTQGSQPCCSPDSTERVSPCKMHDYIYDEATARAKVHDHPVTCT